MKQLSETTLLVFLSDSHIGGDPGCDIFESPEELAALLTEISEHTGPVELVLAGDFFDFLQIGEAREKHDKASMTVARPEYGKLFSALRGFANHDERRVIYMPGNHDAEVWWNPEIRRTLLEEGLVDEFVLSYAARFEAAGDRMVYCEHGNQFDPANVITDYSDPLDTPLGDHIVTDLTRRVVPEGRITKDLSLRDLNKVFPLGEIPAWMVSRLFYDLLGRAVKYLLLPLLAIYIVYRTLAYLLAFSGGGASSFWQSYRSLPVIHEAFLDVVFFGILLIAVFALFFAAMRKTARGALASIQSPASDGRPESRDPQGAEAKIRSHLERSASPPMSSLSASEIDIFISGHTHAPSLSEFRRASGERGLLVNSGCWLRQLHPTPARLHGPPVFASKFVQTHVRVFVRDSALKVELWEHPKPAAVNLRLAERLALLGRMPDQPLEDQPPRVMLTGSIPASADL